MLYLIEITQPKCSYPNTLNPRQNKIDIEKNDKVRIISVICFCIKEIISFKVKGGKGLKQPHY